MNQKISTVLAMMVGAAFLLLVLTATSYFLRFGSLGPGDQAAWGQFGDYLGGTLNPLLAFMSLIALLFTVSLQVRQLQMAAEQLENSKKELEASRAQLEASVQEQRRLSKSAQRQANYTASAAQLAGLRVSLEIVISEIKEMQDYPENDNAIPMQAAMATRARLIKTIESITNQLMYVPGGA